MPRSLPTSALIGFALSLSVQCCLAAQPIAPEVAELCNLLKNGGFEQGEATPASWGRYPGEDKDGRTRTGTGTCATPACSIRALRAGCCGA